MAKDDELLGLMRDSGCQQVLIGLESPRRRSLDGVELNNNWKLRQRERYLAAIEKIQSYGITVNGCLGILHAVRHQHSTETDEHR